MLVPTVMSTRTGFTFVFRSVRTAETSGTTLKALPIELSLRFISERTALVFPLIKNTCDVQLHE